MATGDGVLAVAVQKLSDFIIQEATLILGVKGELESIRDELIVMQAFLKDTEQKEDADARIQWWISEIRSVAFNTEDIIDDFYTEVKGKEPSKTKQLAAGFFRFGGKNNVYDIGKEIKALKEKLSDIPRKREVYGISNIDNTQEKANAAAKKRLRRRTVSFDKEEHGFVGFDDEVKLLGTKLSSSSESRCAISIVGMAGSGKTTLAKKLYHAPENSFELRAWIWVSREWSHKDLIVRVVKSLLKEPTDDQFEKMNEDDVKRYLHNLLKDKRYLVVIDDLWYEDAWEDCLRTALPDNNNGSRVIITTRNRFVAGLSNPTTYVHSLRRLKVEESWKLFCNIAFLNQNGVCSPNLADVGIKMVERCDGLPLAIIILGGLLSRTTDPNDWQTIRKRIWQKLTEKSIPISDLLDLSFNDLSRELKSCFLYLGIFPEDYEIGIEKLVQLWIAEGLIQSEGLDIEELAESYLKELDARSLIQLIRNKCRPNSTCRVNDLLRYLAVNKAKQYGYFHIYDESLNTATVPFSARRIAFRSGFVRYMKTIGDHSNTKVRTLSFLNYHGVLVDGDATELLKLINKKFTSLKVLDLEGVKFETRGSEVKLRKQKWKGDPLNNTVTDEQPEMIGIMQDLQAVVVSSETNEIIPLPRGIERLKRLKYLSGSFGTTKGKPISLKDLTDLLCLERIDISGWLTDEKSHETALNAFSRLYNIRMLSLSFDTNHRLSIEPLCRCSTLIHLEMSGSIKSLPKELPESLPNLRYLSLHKAKFVEDPLPTLEKLPNLLVLSLDGFILPMSLIITAAGFHGLVSLSIRNILEDMSLQIDEGALLSLGHIDIDPKLKLFTYPEGLKDLLMVTTK